MQIKSFAYVNGFAKYVSPITKYSGFSFFRHFWDIIFQPFQLLSLAYDHWRGFNTRYAHMVHAVKLNPI